MRQLRDEKIQRIKNFIECRNTFEQAGEKTRSFRSILGENRETKRERERDVCTTERKRKTRIEQTAIKFCKYSGEFSERFAIADVIGRTSSFFRVSRQRRPNLEM